MEVDPRQKTSDDRQKIIYDLLQSDIQKKKEEIQSQQAAIRKLSLV